MDVINHKPIADWERAIKSRPDIEFEEIRLKNNSVIAVNGFILFNGKHRRAQWTYDGRCYHDGRRMKSFDIDL